ncbi:Helicase associated domain protein [Nonomuraea sp. CA-143628]|uniref:helicase associated domain-containing protein n=1 Tax=Nonomuraea sp. CA-143628 TaxID=3239997 RepID=UPI003D8EB7E2
MNNTYDMSGMWADKLRPHQLEAVEVGYKSLVDGGRATQVLSCGTGKTRIGAVLAATLAAEGLRLVLAPTVMLLAQLLREYRATVGDSALGRVLVVCSESGAAERAGVEELQNLHVQVTTDPAVIASAASPGGPVTVLSTYSSVGALSRAHHEHGLPAWDVVIADEAHRTVGGEEWRRVHNDGDLPARRRLYMTATPRRLQGERRDSDAVGMDDEAVFGPTIYRLGYGTARDLGLSADYRLVVSLVTDAQIRAVTDQTHGRAAVHVCGKRIAARMLAAQIAMLRTAAQYRIKRAISYHNTNDDARHFAATLPAVADLMPDDCRPTGLWADHVRYEQPAHVRHQRLEQLASGVDGGLAALANARMLGEGVDVPAVDAVLFADPRRSTVDIVQAIGRALRTGGQTDKVATIVVPLLADPGANLAAEMEGSDFAPLWEVVRALRGHDEDLAADLDRRRREHARRDHQPRAIRWLSVEGADVPETFARAITVGVVESATASWEEYYGAACAYAEANHDLLIPQDWVSETGLRVGVWLKSQRTLFSRGTLRPERIKLLNAIGITWSVTEADWRRRYAALVAYHRERGNIDVSTKYVTPDKIRLGAWLNSIKSRQDSLTVEHRALLDALGMKWDKVVDQFWERGYAAAVAYHRERGHLRVPPRHVTSDNFKLGNWIGRQRRRADQLTDRQRQRLDELDMNWSPRQAAWDEALAAATAYANKRGHLHPKVTYITDDDFPLGSWLSQKRSAKEQLTPDQRAALNALDPTWTKTTVETLWEQGVAAATAYAKEHGHLHPEYGHVTDNNFRLSRWLVNLRYRKNLTPDQRAVLDALDPTWDQPQPRRRPAPRARRGSRPPPPVQPRAAGRQRRAPHSRATAAPNALDPDWAKHLRQIRWEQTVVALRPRVRPSQTTADTRDTRRFSSRPVALQRPMQGYHL